MYDQILHAQSYLNSLFFLLVSCFSIIMPSKREFLTPSSKKRTLKKSQKAGMAATSQTLAQTFCSSYDIHYPDSSLQTTLSVDDMPLFNNGLT